MNNIRQDILQNNIVPFGWKINYIANQYSLIANNKLRTEFKITRQEFVVLFCVVNSTHVTAHDICLVAGRPKNTISRAVRSLLQSGCISTTPNPQDARSEIIELTPYGREFYNKIIEIFQEQERLLTSNFTSSELKTLERLLNKIIETINPEK
jgi:DNA-binding MarR family transcriptional regulator